MYIFEVRDKTKRWIYLTDKRYSHIMQHSEMQNKIEEIKETLINPLKIINYSLEDDIKYYYRYYKNRKSTAKYLRVIVKYLNGKGFIITSYFVDRI
ncbi:hypothetical protein J4437_08415 [Candidatus Woesearchaeota archaeon]|nr:hypothetical protein [Candidatus Woesearchaeota archaeon]